MTRTARTPLNGHAVTRRPVSRAKPEPEDERADTEDRDTIDAGDDVPAGRPPVDALSEMMASLQGASTSRITVYRIVKNQPPSYVFECDPTSFSLDDLRDKYNGGEFRLYVMKDGRLFKNMRVVVEPKQMFHGQEPAPPSTTPMVEMMAAMREGFAAQAAALREAMSSRPTVSPFANMDIPAIITAAAAALTALRPPPAPAAPVESTSKAIDMFMQGLQLARELREDAGPADTSIGGMLRDVLKSPLVAAAVQASVPTATPTPQPPRLPNPQPQPAAQVSHAKTPEPAPKQENQVLDYYLGFLVGKARIGSDPSLYAELVLDNIPDDQLTPMLARGDALIDDLIAIHPPVAEHRDWFTALLKEINDLLAPEETTETLGETHATDAAAPVVSGQPSA